MKLYNYCGTIDSFSVLNGSKTMDIVLSETFNDDKAPILLRAGGALAKYIDAIEGTDAEERYLKSSWYFDSTLYLRRIEVPSTDPHIPAKIITSEDPWSSELVIFGPEEYIEDTEPNPMDQEVLYAWYEWKSKHA